MTLKENSMLKLLVSLLLSPLLIDCLVRLMGTVDVYTRRDSLRQPRPPTCSTRMNIVLRHCQKSLATYAAGGDVPLNAGFLTAGARPALSL
ncbi:hypothetical protein K474DRAFT_1196840 [Panus rudis PR-1116 ss-1]|nr:hypothetical protein K474DRAFT_1196840 [Panus rudis PR-1116 ss-1]